MARILTISKGNLPLANAGLKLSKKILITEIEAHPDFQALFTIDEDVLSRITNDMVKNSYDNSQPLHLWFTKDEEGNDHKYLIDGYTRLQAAKNAGLESVPYYEHNFETLDEAYRYALHLQTDRRNLEGMDLLKNIEFLMGSDYIKNLNGNKNSAIGKILGVSEKTVERGNKVLKEASPEELEAIEKNEKSVNKVHKDIQKRKKETGIDSTETNSNDEEFLDSVDFSESINPIENPSPIDELTEDIESELEEPEEANNPNETEESFASGYRKGWSCGAYAVYEKISDLISEGKNIDEILNDEIFSDFSFSEIAKKFSIPISTEEIVKNFINKEFLNIRPEITEETNGK